VLVVHGTRKFLDRVKGPVNAGDEKSTTELGDWYATVLFWKPQVALFVNELTLVPVLVPMAPAVTVLDRLVPSVAAVLRAHGLGPLLVDNEVAEMMEQRLTTTQNRSMVGIMNEFAYLGEVYVRSNDAIDLPALSLRLAKTPCGPLYARHGSPDRELVAFAAQWPE